MEVAVILEQCIVATPATLVKAQQPNIPAYVNDKAFEVECMNELQAERGASVLPSRLVVKIRRHISGTFSFCRSVLRCHCCPISSSL